MVATVESELLLSSGLTIGLERGEAADSVKFHLVYDDLEGEEVVMDLEVVFEGEFTCWRVLMVVIRTYASTYRLLLFAEEALSRRAQTTFARFKYIYDLDMLCLIERIVKSLQGDDDANGGEPPEEDIFDDGEVELDCAVVEELGRGFEVAKGSVGDFGKGWTVLKE